MIDIATIDVTQEDIAKGDARNPESCPVALAASRVCKQPMMAGSYRLHSVMGATQYRTGAIPKSVQRWIEDFDEGRSVEPIKFEVMLYGV